MTAIAITEEKRTEALRQKRENAINAEICRMLMRTKEESLQSFYKDLTVIIGVGDVLPQAAAIELVF